MKNVADALRPAGGPHQPARRRPTWPRIWRIRARLLSFVVVGGGYTGVETAGQLYDFVRQAHRYYPNLRHSVVRVVLVHAQGELLGEIGPDLGAYARRSLEDRGVEVRPQLAGGSGHGQAGGAGRRVGDRGQHAW